MHIEELNKIIFDVLQYRRASPTETKQFVRMKHNSDLCPQIQEKLEKILDAFEKYRKITYDIQGIRDMGTDIVIRESTDDHTSYICFQIKTEDDFKKADILKTLKSQWFDTERAYKELINYYILVCVDTHIEKEVKVSRGRSNRRLQVLKKVQEKKSKPKIRSKNKELLRTITAEFGKNPSIFVIEPEYVITFLKLATVQIDATIRSKLGSDDIVFQKAVDLVADLTPSESSILYYLLWESIFQKRQLLSFEDIISSTICQSLYAKIPDYQDRDDFFVNRKKLKLARDTRERIALDLQCLADTFVFLDDDQGYFINLNDLQPLAIHMMDANQRYLYEDEELIGYMLQLFNSIDYVKT